MTYLFLMTIAVLALSACVDRVRTAKALRLALVKLGAIAPVFGAMIVAASVAVYFLSDEIIMTTLGNSNSGVGLVLGATLGSVSIMPGFIAYPLAGVLLKKGVDFMVVSALTTTLMMVGVLTAPVEARYFGARITVARNVLAFAVALVVAIVTGICFGEISW